MVLKSCQVRVRESGSKIDPLRVAVFGKCTNTQRREWRDFRYGAFCRRICHVQPRVPIDRAEKLGRGVGTIRRAQKQVTVQLQRVMQHGTELLLLLSIEMHQQITTNDQIDTYEGWVLEHIMRGKQDTVARL